MKILSLLTYLLRNFENRQFAEASKPNEEVIAKNVLTLLRNCPGDVISTRKEILLAIRHILNTQDFKKGFFSHTDVLLDEKILIGRGHPTAVAVLRPIAYTTIFEFVNYVKDTLSLAQLTKIVYNFSQNLHDSDLSFSVQTTCVRILFVITERLSHGFNKVIYIVYMIFSH